MSRDVGLFGLRPTPLGHKWALQMASYVDLKGLPPIPAGAFGHASQVTKPWDIYLNDQLGDCVVAGSQHNVRLWLAEGTGSDTVTFDDAATIKNYEGMGHYNPNNPDSDQGCDMLFAAEYWMRTGIVDASGKIHKVGAALQLDCGPGYLNLDQLWYAAYLFDGLGLGIGVTGQMQQDFADGKPWTAASYDPTQVEGGHFVPLIARESDSGNLVGEVITWAQPQEVTTDGLTAITNTVLVYATQEKLHNGKDEEGLGWSDLRSDIKKLNRMGSLQGIHRL